MRFVTFPGGNGRLRNVSVKVKGVDFWTNNYVTNQCHDEWSIR